MELAKGCTHWSKEHIEFRNRLIKTHLYFEKVKQAIEPRQGNLLTNYIGMTGHSYANKITMT